MEQRLILIKQREDGLALKKEMEQHLQVWYVRAIKSTFKKTSEKLRAHLGVAGKQDNLLQKRLNDEINSICMATILYELWTQMDTMNEKRGKGTPRAVFDLVAAHRLADKDGKLTTSDGRHFTAEGYGTFMRAASVQVLDQHMRAHNTDRKYQLWFVPVIDADSLLLEIDSLKKYYAPRQYTTPGRFRPLRPPVTRPSHVDHNWAEHRTGDHDDDNSETGSYHSEIGMIEAEYESVDDESSSADDRMWDIGVGFYFR
ncbi:hypothetical protein BCR37DRAFT_83384 [Protomyces lactucae-debilis]|uniref:Uncharacterized protein n=1 Tax=Protomyces lactucae-debilis TaxID=2754530 RepID=A0A1Y2F9I6_PROLT|nr:uncharacterized protein BCR37DRAFT_83384 [Protomyces lactucae-debilis]ORY79986.1 hypothetical protein BCR37DRAFT_83384 [Protomyces lactucae-debilis]